MNLFGWLPRLGPQLNPVQQKLAQLESQLATAQQRLQESITIAATPVSPLDRFVDGDRYLVPGGTRQDRQFGSNRPVLNQQWDLNQMRTNARLLLDANGFAIGGMDRLIDFVVGEGFKREITLRDAEPGATSDTEDPLIRQVTMLLDDWCKKYEWGHGEEDREAETFKRTSRDGEVFTRVDKDKKSDSWMPWIRFVEPEHVYTPPDKSQMSEWSWGILTKEDDVETRLAYWVVDPKAQTQAGDVVDAADIFHHKVNTDRTIKRGISDFFPVFDTFESARKILRNMGEVAAIQAAIAWIRQHAATTTADQVQRMIDRTKNYDQTNMRPVFPQGPDNTQPVTFTEPGQVLDMSNGMQYLAGPSATGSPGFIQVLQATLRGAGARWGAPEFFSGDASNNNFASILVSGSPFERYAKRRQSAFSAYQERIFYRVLEYAEKAGEVPPGTCGRVKIRCIPPAVAIANRNEDEQIRAQQNQAGVLSRTTWQRQVNLDPKIEAENFRREKEQDQQGQPGDAGQNGMGALPQGGVMESYTQPQYELLSEGARSGLVKKMITNKLGDHQTVWTRPAEVNPSADAGHHTADDHADATPTEATKNAFATVFGKARELGNKAMNSKVGRVLKEAEHKLGIAAHKTRDVAVKAAEMRGLDEGQTKKLKASLAMADFFGGYVSGAAAGAVAGPLGAKVAMFMPSASAVYLAYSTAQDPVATWKAALQVVEESSIDPRHVASAFSKAWFATESAYHWVDALADLLNADEDVADWTQALFLAALAVTHDPEQAVAFAGQHSTDDGSMEESRQVTATGELLEEGRNLSGLSKVKRTDRNGVSRYVYVRTGGDEGNTPKKAGQRSEEEHESHSARVHAMLERPESLTLEHLSGLADDLGKMTVAELKTLRSKTGAPTGRLKADRISKIVEYAKSLHGQAKKPNEMADAGPENFKVPDGFTTGPGNKPNKALPRETRPQLTISEAEAVENYTGSTFYALNKVLRAGEDVGRWSEVHEGLRGAFAKVKPTPKPVTSYRWVANNPELIALFEKAASTGPQVQLKGYISTSTQEDMITDMNNKSDADNIKYVINCREGLDVRPYSSLPQEDELLLNHNSRFRIESVQRDVPGWSAVVVMSQVLTGKNNE